MNNSPLHGSALLIMILLVAAVAGIGMFVRDAQGTPYTESVYNLAHYYVVGRGEEAVQAAKDAQAKMQEHQNEVQKEIDTK